MENKINVVKRDLRALKANSHALKRLIEIQGIHYTRIKTLSSLPESEKIKKAIEEEKKLILALNLENQIAENVRLEEKYFSAMSSFSLKDKAMMMDCFIKGLPYWKIAMEYNLSEEGVRKHINSLIKKIATST